MSTMEIIHTEEYIEMLKIEELIKVFLCILKLKYLHLW